VLVFRDDNQAYLSAPVHAMHDVVPDHYVLAIGIFYCMRDPEFREAMMWHARQAIEAGDVGGVFGVSHAQRN
jgi:hypothetical protein